MKTDVECGFDSTDSLPDGADSKELIRSLWRHYLIKVLGIPRAEAESRIEREVQGEVHKEVVSGLEWSGWSFENRVVVDVGCGTGALLTQLLSRGAFAVGIEHSPSWSSAAEMRVKELGGKGQVIRGSAVALPLKDGGVDYAFCLQVLEHLDEHSFRLLISEIARVVRGGGKVFVTFEDYLSFWEPHYRVKWLPFLPKWIGALYLRIIGRNPAFLLEHVHYRSGLTVALLFSQNHLVRESWIQVEDKIMHPSSIRRPHIRVVAKLVRLLPRALLRALVISYSERGQLFKTTFTLELVHMNS